MPLLVSFKAMQENKRDMIEINSFNCKLKFCICEILFKYSSLFQFEYIIQLYTASHFLDKCVFRHETISPAVLWSPPFTASSRCAVRTGIGFWIQERFLRIDRRYHQRYIEGTLLPKCSTCWWYRFMLLSENFVNSHTDLVIPSFNATMFYPINWKYNFSVKIWKCFENIPSYALVEPVAYLTSLIGIVSYYS